MSITENMTPDVNVFTNGNGGGGFGNGWGGDGAFWIIILFLFAFCGWGGNGGGWGNNGGGVQSGYVLASDFSNIERKIDGVYSGICDSTYALNNGIQNGFAAAQSTMTQGFAGLNTGMIQQGYEGRIATQNVGNQLNQCCCDIRSDLAGINYNLATQSSNIQNTVNSGLCQVNRGVERGFADIAYNASSNTTAIIQNQHNDTDRVIQKLCDMESARQAEKIAQLTAENQGLKFAQSQSEQNAYLVSQLGYQCPKPAYVVQPPQPVTFPNGCNGCCNG